MARRGWELISGSDRLCAIVIREKYLRGGNLKNDVAMPSDSLKFRKDNLRVTDLILKGACIQVGDGSSVNYRIDPVVPHADNFRP